MKHYIKVPKTEKAVEAARSILAAKGVIHTKTARQIVDSERYPAASVVYMFAESGRQNAFWCDSNDLLHQPGPGDTLTDLTPLFKETGVEDTLTATTTDGMDIGRNQTFKVKINLVHTSVGCQTFKNSDILRIADLVRKAVESGRTFGLQ